VSKESLVLVILLVGLVLLPACAAPAPDTEANETPANIVAAATAQASAPSPAPAGQYFTYTSEELGFATLVPEGWVVEEGYEDEQSGEPVDMAVRFYPGPALEPGMTAMAGMSVWLYPAYSPLDTEADLSELLTTFVESRGQQLAHGPAGVEVGDHGAVQAIVCEGDPEQATWVGYETIVAADDRLYWINGMSNVGPEDPVDEAYAHLVSSFRVLQPTLALAPTVSPAPPPATPSPTSTALPTPTSTPRSTVAPSPTPQRVQLRDAASTGLVRTSIRGESLEWIKLILESLIPDPVEVTISPGTVFQSQAAGVQNMVVIQGRTVVLDSKRRSVSLSIPVACANMELDQPDDSHGFGISEAPVPDDLLKLLSVPGFADEDFRVQQFAIWTITDNPSRGGYVGLGYFGVGSGPSSEEMQRIRGLFEQAGIPLERYRAFQ
jgi:hypothetical protein